MKGHHSEHTPKGHAEGDCEDVKHSLYEDLSLDYLSDHCFAPLSWWQISVAKMKEKTTLPSIQTPYPGGEDNCAIM